MSVFYSPGDSARELREAAGAGLRSALTTAVQHSPTGLSSVEIYEDIYTRETHGPVFAPRTEMLSEAPSLASLTRELASGAPDPSGSIENRGRPS